MAVNITERISTIEAWWGLLLLSFAFVASVVALWLFVWPAWKLLALSLYSNSPRRYRPALRQLRGFFMPGLLKNRFLFRSARVRIELELLCPAPERPLRLDYPDDREYAAAEAEWKARRNEWSTEMGRRTRLLIVSDEAPAIDIDTVSELLDNPGIKRYFDSLRLFRPSDPDAPSFVSSVRIGSGFVAPLHLLTGVLARFGEEWQPIVEGYGETMTDPLDPHTRHTAS